MPVAAPPPPPPIVRDYIPYPAKRKREMAAYARRHYGLDTWRLRRPHVIVQHVTANDSLQATIDTFAPDRPDPELGELPGTCAHFVVDKDGTIVQLVRLSFMCRHTVGLNHESWGIEHVAMTAEQVLARPRQLRASLRLVRWLRCRGRIGLANVIGHAESLRSPYHRERVERLRMQTHGDWPARPMRTYRARLAALGRCAELSRRAG